MRPNQSLYCDITTKSHGQDVGRTQITGCGVSDLIALNFFLFSIKTFNITIIVDCAFSDMFSIKTFHMPIILDSHFCFKKHVLNENF
jgi:hypothetical protein